VAVGRYIEGMTEVTQILSQIESGDETAAEKLLPLVYAFIDGFLTDA
jgi:hypothetical protein